MTATIWHNPRCSKSRAALALLVDAGAKIEVIDYLATPPTRETLAALYAKAGMKPRQGLRATEPGARSLMHAADGTVLDAMAANPALIQRPLVQTARGVRLARPPERVLEIL